jgi:hypothetical protein
MLHAQVFSRRVQCATSVTFALFPSSIFQTFALFEAIWLHGEQKTHLGIIRSKSLHLLPEARRLQIIPLSSLRPTLTTWVCPKLWYQELSLEKVLPRDQQSKVKIQVILTLRIKIRVEETTRSFNFPESSCGLLYKSVGEREEVRWTKNSHLFRRRYFATVQKALQWPHHFDKLLIPFHLRPLFPC